MFISIFRTILEKDVNECDFLEQLHELQHKLIFLKAQEFKDAKAAGDVRDVVENLKFKVGTYVQCFTAHHFNFKSSF
jgi:uncharacterized membrane protein